MQIYRKDAHKDGTKTTEAYFVYDYLGNRVKKVVNGKTTYYINDSLNQGHTVLNEIQSNGKVTKSLVHGPTGLLAEVIGEDKIRYIHKDRQGSTVMLTNGGAILSKYYYDAYGEPHVFYEIPDYVAVTAKTVYDGEKTTNYLYTGQEYDVETGLYYYNARYYDPTKGSFISKDPMRGYLGDLLSRNRYTYVKNNPFKYTDPSGNFASEGESYYGYLASIHPQFAGGLYRANPLATDQSGCGVIMSCDNSSSYSFTSSSSSSPNFTPAPKPEFDLKSGSAYSYTPEPEEPTWVDHATQYINDAVYGTSRTVIDNYTYGVGVKNYDELDSTGYYHGEKAGEVVTMTLVILETLGGLGVTGTGVTLTGGGALTCPATAGGGCLVAAEGVLVTASGIAIVSHAGSVVVYSKSKSGNSSGKSDKKLNGGEIKKLKEKGIDPHDLKPNSKYDLFKDKKGNIKVKPKKGTGPGEPTGYNINDFY